MSKVLQIPEGTRITLGKSGDLAEIQAIHLPGDWQRTRAVGWLHQHGFSAATMRARAVTQFASGAPATRSPAPTADLTFSVAKTTEELQIAFGWFYVVERANGTLTVDYSQEVSDKWSLEKSLYGYVLDHRRGGINHSKYCNGCGHTAVAAGRACPKCGSSNIEVVQIGRLAEAVYVSEEKRVLWGLSDEAIRASKLHIGIWGGIRVDDSDTWLAVKSGDLPEFSIGGFARIETL